jgi:hypothetical protein
MQLGISFLAGGGALTLFSLLAEKAPRKVAGIIIMFPSTIVIGLFFLGITSSAEEAASAIPSILFPLAILIFTSLIYIRLAIFFAASSINRPFQIFITFLTSTVIWFALAAPFAMHRFTGILPGTLTYLAAVIGGTILFSKIDVTEVPPLLTYNRKQILFRAVFMGIVIASIVFIGKTAGTFWGAIFTMYPAATFSALMIFHYYYVPHHLYHFYSNAPLGSVTLYAYCVSAMFFFPLFGLAWGTLAAYFVSLLTAIIIVRIQKIYHAAISRNRQTDLT